MMTHPAMGGSKGKDVRVVHLTDEQVEQLDSWLDTPLNRDSRQRLEQILTAFVRVRGAHLEDAWKAQRAAARRFEALYARDAHLLPARDALDQYRVKVLQHAEHLPKSHRGPKVQVMRLALADWLREFYRPTITPPVTAASLRSEDAFVRLAASFVGVSFDQKKRPPYQRQLPAPP